jgi:hypothetical protein
MTEKREMPQDRQSFAVACTLGAADYKHRLAWIAELNTAALHDYRRAGARIELTYHPSAEARVRELVRREQQCCPFLDFSVRREDDVVMLEITGPEDVGDAADALFAPYTATQP